jgi:hypothetical protein
MKSKQPAKPKTASQKPARQKKSVSLTPSVPENLHERIARRAFENYERRIRQGSLDDWLQAEQEILGHTMPHRGGYAGEEQD